MANKRLSERLNNELDLIGIPSLMVERVQVCSKLFKLPKFKVEALLKGVVAIDSSSIEKIAEELEVDASWLMGNKVEKH